MQPKNSAKCKIAGSRSTELAASKTIRNCQRLYSSHASVLQSSSKSTIAETLATDAHKLSTGYRSKEISAFPPRVTLTELRRGFERNEFELYFQPQVSLSDTSIIGAEVLLRWRHPDRGLLLPVSFMSQLENCSVALALGWWVLNEACYRAARWQEIYVQGFKVSVNLFATQLYSPVLLPKIKTALLKNMLDPRFLEIEITETTNLLKRNVRTTLEQLKSLGVGVAADDFGIGFASLSSLHHLTFSTLKIDKSFIATLDGNPRSLIIVRSLIDLSKQIGLTTIAEGVETLRQEEILCDLGCNYAQGYRYGRPLSLIKFEKLLFRQADKR